MYTLCVRSFIAPQVIKKEKKCFVQNVYIFTPLNLFINRSGKLNMIYCRNNTKGKNMLSLLCPMLQINFYKEQGHFFFQLHYENLIANKQAS